MIGAFRFLSMLVSIGTKPTESAHQFPKVTFGSLRLAFGAVFFSVMWASTASAGDTYFKADFDSPNGSCGDANLAGWTEEADEDFTTVGTAGDFVSANCSLQAGDASGGFDKILSPIIDLSGATDPVLQFQIKGDVNLNSEQIEIGWRVGGSGFTRLELYSDTDDSFEMLSYVLPSGALSSTFQIIFETENVIDVDEHYYIDDISVQEPTVVSSNADTNTVGTLRYAINYANANATKDEITFDIGGVGPHEITLSSTLPVITDNGVSIDGTTQTGSACGNLWAGTAPTLKIRVDGASNSFLLFDISATNVLLKGLSVTRGSNAIRGLGGASNLTLQCNYIGLSPDGSAAGSTNYGVGLYNANTLVGGLTAGQGNVISSNGRAILTYSGSSATAIRGNFIGVDPSGMSARANTAATINHWSGSASWSDITKNLISGNTSHAINVEADDTISGSAGDLVIAGNYIGVDRTGGTALANGGDGINFDGGPVTGVKIGGVTLADRNIISGNGGEAVQLSNLSDIQILGNYIGVGQDGSSPITNTNNAVRLSTVSDIDIGNGSAMGRNLIGSSTVAIQMIGTNSALSINGNYFNTDSSGNSSILTGQDGLELNGAITTLNILDNVMGEVTQDKIEFWGGHTATGVTIQGNKLGVGADGVTNISGGIGAAGLRIWAGYAVTGLTLGGSGEGEGNVIGNNQLSGVYVDSATSGDIVGNTIYANVDDGIEILSTTAALAIYGNSIYNNAGIGIDLGTTGVTANDADDGDTGANDLLNFPVFNALSGDGTTIFYDFNLDTVSNANGYRVDLYVNAAADPTGYGEGETHLGFVDIAHSGGDLNFTGSFTGLLGITQEDIVSATTTRKTGASSYDNTSEFSLNYTTDAATELTASKSVDVFDPTSADLYALPGNDVISSMTVTNIGNSAADTDSIVIIDAVPSEMTFYNGDMDDGGPATQAVHFTQTGGANLTFTYASDAAYSNSGSRPANMAGCTYTPSPGYDSNVTYVCFNPKGAMAAGDPDPTATLQYRAQIK
ncbi:hypothetical protein GCM10009069_26230 [Algimonas arctica]|uniref:Right handed beta helix domain-containing protein n=1 Tax=Algimonas arctica TaxID=1479486 RepID=A0A8J3G3H0_9PROT|nr:right-handed parallel beta-helix repeat-containing protein [Algimonas arctica]GHB02197.1 hypothetical protein GCM10009069_26230 [Algimonas arctica]